MISSLVTRAGVLLVILLLMGCAQTEKAAAPEQGAQIASEGAEPTQASFVANAPKSTSLRSQTFDAETECINACKESTIELSNGPCLLNPMSNTEWVCDVAHSPREDIDNVKESQCSEFGKQARHFIEVDTNCNLIKKV